MRTILFMLAVILLGSCGFTSVDVVSSEPSPAGGVEARLYEINGGALTSFGYRVRIADADDNENREAGKLMARLYGAVRSERAFGANLRWENNELLVVEYWRAEEAEVVRPRIRVAGRTVRVELRPGVVDPDAPSGGMLYNLQGRPNDCLSTPGGYGVGDCVAD